MALGDVLPALFDNYFIKFIFLAHSMLISLAIISIKNNGDTFTYGLYNIIFLQALLLAILVDKSADIALVATGYNVICVFMDILYLITSSYIGVTATLMVVFNLIARPLSTILLLRNYSARAGIDDPTGGLLEVTVQAAGAQPRSTYYDIDVPSQPRP